MIIMFKFFFFSVQDTTISPGCMVDFDVECRGCITLVLKNESLVPMTLTKGSVVGQLMLLDDTRVTEPAAQEISTGL